MNIDNVNAINIKILKKKQKKVKKILTEGGGGGIIYKHSQESARSLKTEQETSISKETKKRKQRTQVRS